MRTRTALHPVNIGAAAIFFAQPAPLGRPARKAHRLIGIVLTTTYTGRTLEERLDGVAAHGLGIECGKPQQSAGRMLQVCTVMEPSRRAMFRTADVLRPETPKPLPKST